MQTVTLEAGVVMPMLAFGTGTALLKRGKFDGSVDREKVDMIKKALCEGYRHLDTAEMYNTELETGVAIKESGIPRDQLFVTTKIASNFLNAEQAIETSLKKLQLDYVDLYLMHTPYLTKEDGGLDAAWKSMCIVKRSGKARSIGVSNFNVSHLNTILETADAEGVKPTVNQIEFHPYMPHRTLFSFQKEHGIYIAAYGALAPLTHNNSGPLDGLLLDLAKKYNTSPSQVCMRWCIEQSVIVITTTRKSERMREYLQAFDFSLTSEEVSDITSKGNECVDGKEMIPRIVKYYQSLGTDVTRDTETK